MMAGLGVLCAAAIAASATTTQSVSLKTTKRYFRIKSSSSLTSSVSLQRNPNHLRHRREVESPVGLVAIPYANRAEFSIFVRAFLDAQVLSLLAGSAVARLKIHSAEKSA